MFFENSHPYEPNILGESGYSCMFSHKGPTLSRLFPARCLWISFLKFSKPHCLYFTNIYYYMTQIKWWSDHRMHFKLVTIGRKLNIQSLVGRWYHLNLLPSLNLLPRKSHKCTSETVLLSSPWWLFVFAMK